MERWRLRPHIHLQTTPIMKLQGLPRTIAARDPCPASSTTSMTSWRRWAMDLRGRTAVAPKTTSKICLRRTPAREIQTATSALRSARRGPRAYSYPAVTPLIVLALLIGLRRTTHALCAVLHSTLSAPRPSADLLKWILSTSTTFSLSWTLLSSEKIWFSHTQMLTL